MEQLKQLEQQLIDKAQLQGIANDVAKAANIKYEMAIEKAMKADPELRALRTSNVNAQEAAKTAKSDYAETKASAIESLLALTNPEDIKGVDAFGYRQQIESDYGDKIVFVQNVVKSGMLFLLHPDHAMIDQFVKGMAIKTGDPYMPNVLPEEVMSCIPGLRINTVIKPTISDPKISKLAAVEVEAAKETTL